jgi:UPF0755 protein
MEEKSSVITFTKTKILFLVFVFLLLSFLFFISAPVNVKSGYIEVNKGENIKTIISTLKKEGFIKSEIITLVFYKLLNKGEIIKTGNYFIEKENSFSLMYNFINNKKISNKNTKLVIKEGFNRLQILEEIPSFVKDKNTFLEKTKGEEGFLFPDTYFINTSTDILTIIKMMEDRYGEVFTKISSNKKYTKKEEYELIILASILEGEGKGFEDKKIIAGILYNRLKIGMRLQVDTTTLFIKDYKNIIDSKTLEKYDTYQYTGLPPGPINNPGETSIIAAMNPYKNDYLYYITGNDGRFYYATTFEKHRQNIKNYLK